MTRKTTPQPTVPELWAAYERQKEQVKTLSATHQALCDQAAEAYEAFKVSDDKLRELFDVAYEAEFGHKFADRRTKVKLAA
jgi:hypothetical protein